MINVIALIIKQIVTLEQIAFCHGLCQVIMFVICSLASPAGVQRFRLMNSMETNSSVCIWVKGTVCLKWKLLTLMSIVTVGLSVLNMKGVIYNRMLFHTMKVNRNIFFE